MHIAFMVEEPSMQALLDGGLAAKLLGNRTDDGIDFGSKGKLLSALERRLKAYASWMPSDYRIVVMVDEDRQDCRGLKAKLEEAARNAGLATRSVDRLRWVVLPRVVVEEMEAWLLGDSVALRTAYPKLPDFSGKVRYRNPDAVGGSWRRYNESAWWSSEGSRQPKGRPHALPRFRSLRRVRAEAIGIHLLSTY